MDLDFSFNRKERKERREQNTETGRFVSLLLFRPREFSDFKFVRPEVDEKTVFDSGRFELPDDLRFMFRRERSGDFQFNHQHILNEQIRKVFAEESSVFVVNVDWMLLPDVQTSFGQTIHERVLVHFFQMSMTVINMNVISNLPNLITQRLDVVHNNPFFGSVLF